MELEMFPNCQTIKVPMSQRITISTNMQFRIKSFKIKLPQLRGFALREIIKSDLEKQIGTLRRKHKYRYGYRKITAILKQGMRIYHKTVQRIMQKNHWQCRVQVKKRQEYGAAVCRGSEYFGTGLYSERPLKNSQRISRTCLMDRNNCICPVYWTCTMEKSLLPALEKSKILPLSYIHLTSSQYCLRTVFYIVTKAPCILLMSIRKP